MINTENKHHGRSIKRIREMQEMKQADFAQRISQTLNEQWDQPKVSFLEDKEKIDDDFLKLIAPILNVTPEIIKNFDLETILNVFAPNSIYHDNSSANFQCTFNPIDKLVEVFEENKKLYEDLLNSEKEKSEQLQEMNKVLQNLLERLNLK